MTDSMIERVARALAQAGLFEVAQEGREHLARAAIAAMREPPPEMCEAARIVAMSDPPPYMVPFPADSVLCSIMRCSDFTDHWRAGIDFALGNLTVEGNIRVTKTNAIETGVIALKKP